MEKTASRNEDTSVAKAASRKKDTSTKNISCAETKAYASGADARLEVTPGTYRKLLRAMK